MGSFCHFLIPVSRINNVMQLSILPNIAGDKTCVDAFALSEGIFKGFHIAIPLQN